MTPPSDVEELGLAWDGDAKPLPISTGSLSASASHTATLRLRADRPLVASLSSLGFAYKATLGADVPENPRNLKEVQGTAFLEEDLVVFSPAKRAFLRANVHVDHIALLVVTFAIGLLLPVALLYAPGTDPTAAGSATAAVADLSEAELERLARQVEEDDQARPSGRDGKRRST